MTLLAGCTVPAAEPPLASGGAGKGDGHSELDLPPGTPAGEEVVGAGLSWGDTAEGDERETSANATFVDFTFEARVRANHRFSIAGAIETQLLYTVGQLNGDNSIGRLDNVGLEVGEVRELEDGGVEADYQATMLVAWGEPDRVPEEYVLRMPIDMRYGHGSDEPMGQEAFVQKYGRDCAPGHQVTANDFWYYYRPASRRCTLDESDAPGIDARVSPSETETRGAYPEYHRIWQDDELSIVAIWGKYDDGATSSWDAGISAYNTFVRRVGAHLRDISEEVTTEPMEVPDSPGTEVPEVTFTARLAGDRTVIVHSRLVDNVRHALRTEEFREWYGARSVSADFIAYNGHSGLGANIEALGQHGRWQPGKYAIAFMNGCDTYAYVNSELWDRHAEINEDDDTGTKYLDLVMNAMPSYFRSMASASMALVEGLTGFVTSEVPQTYEEIFRKVDRSQVILVSGEQDNEFGPE